MKILIVAASENEINPLRNFIEVGKMQSSVDILITGIGSVATAYALTKQLQKKKYDLALNFGLAGSFNTDLEIGSVVNVTQEHFADLGAEDGEIFLTLDEMGFAGSNEIINESEIKNKVLELIPQVCGITVNTVHGNEMSIEKVFNRFHPNSESMEGAAFLYCCMQEKIPCAQVRAISNFVERRNKDRWNIPLAIEHLNRNAIEILKAFEI
ncbi:MAG TPA: futalosine hydrolase [Bacteroidia bacterium]|nr:futalosine hydrolase [Bacteroidia bacterium]